MESEATDIICLVNSLGLSGWNDEFLSMLNDETVIGVRCVAHSLQLAIHSALKSLPSVTTFINLCRAVAKSLRKESLVNDLKEKTVYTKHPTLDCITRWSSIHLMVKDLDRYSTLDD